MSENSGDAKVAEQFLAAYSAHDWQALRALFAEDIAWTMPGAGTISGTVHGIAAALDRVQEIVGRGLRTQLLHLLVGRHGVALSLRNTAVAPDGRTLDEHLATVLTIREGKIAAIDSYLSDVDGMSAFFR
ncbi:nuclear transport factor 2 family protein [Streptomyces sp. NPDC101393]|uniref:nuclear transport factor 2 family protein n=1 Tax=Streptomyces sp. NPDC101393 TaxID=3366141 RepID=UPI00380F3781